MQLIAKQARRAYLPDLPWTSLLQLLSVRGNRCILAPEKLGLRGGFIQFLLLQHAVR